MFIFCYAHDIGKIQISGEQLKSVQISTRLDITTKQKNLR